jgi:site-specific DNA-methyltransferase (adenine-specific)
MSSRLFFFGGKEMAKIKEFYIVSDYRDEVKGLDSLALSIENDGLYQPIIVKPYEGEKEGVKFEIIAGRRRFRAMSEYLGWTELKKNEHYMVKEGCDALIAQFQENFNRQDFTPSELASLIKDIHTQQVEKHGRAIKGQTGGWSLKDTGKMIGRDSSFVSRMLTIADNAALVKDCPSVSKALELVDKHKARKVQKIVRKAQYEAETEVAAAIVEDHTIEKWISNVRNETALDYLAGMKDNSIDFILTDPPYAINFDKLNKSLEQDTYADDPEQVKEDLTAVVKELYRVLAEGRYAVIFTAFRWFEWLVNTMEAVGFKCAGTPICWVKLNTSGKSLNPDITLGSQCEIAVYGWKGVPCLTHPGAGNVFPVKIVRENRIHVAQKPEELLENIINTFTLKHMSVLDVYGGSLSTLRAAYKTDRLFYGCEALYDNYVNAINHTREWARKI